MPRIDITDALEKQFGVGKLKSIEDVDSFLATLDKIIAEDGDVELKIAT